MKVTRRKAGFIKQFIGPGDNGIVCFRFWQAVVASGCPGACAYCFLQTQTPYRRGLYALSGTLFENLKDMVPEVEEWLRQPRPAGLLIGENQDGLAFERHYKRLIGVTPLELLVPLFADSNPHRHTLVVLSKFTTTEFAEANGPSPHVVFSWSLSLPSVSKRYEKGVAPLERRLAAAARLKRAGWRVRFRLDALAPIPGWQDEITDILKRINEVEPEMLTVGVMRASSPSALRQAAIANGRDAAIISYVKGKDDSGFKHKVEREFQVQVFRRITELLDSRVQLGLCKEDAGIWVAAGVNWGGCHCLHSAVDRVVDKRGNPDDLLCDLDRRLASRPHEQAERVLPDTGSISV